MNFTLPKVCYKYAAVAVLLTVLAGCSYLEQKTVPFSDVRTLTKPERKLGEPFGIAVRNREVFVSDGQNGIIWKADVDGVLSEFSKGFSTPSAIAFSENGDLIVADSGDHTIKSVNARGKVTVLAGKSGERGSRDGNFAEARFNAPVGVAVEGAKVFVADTYNDRIRVVENGKVKTVAGSGQGYLDDKKGTAAKFNTPAGIAVLKGKLVVADTGNRRIRIVEADGKTWTLAGNGDAERRDGLLPDASFEMPVGVEVDEAGSIFVADGNAVRAIGGKFLPIVETVAGRGRGYSDSALKNARFSRVTGLAFAGNGDLFVADADNSMIRVISGRGTGHRASAKDIDRNRPTAKEFRGESPARWPYSPPEKAREVAGTLGEIRGEVNQEGVNAWFHNGLDIVGGYGEKATAIRTEKILHVLPIDSFGTKRENIRFPEIGYVHIRFGRDQDGRLFEDERFQFRRNSKRELIGLRVPRGSVFKAGDTLGTLNTMNHVHLISGKSGREMNALDALTLPGVSDTRTPSIERVDLYDRQGKPISPTGDSTRFIASGKLRIVAEAYDQMDGNAERRRLGLYKLGYQLLDAEGNPEKGYDKPFWTILFEKTPSNDFVGLVFAPGSRSGATGTTTFRYIITNRVNGLHGREGFLDMNGKKAGDYVLRIFAADYFGNTASKDLELRVE